MTAPSVTQLEHSIDQDLAVTQQLLDLLHEEQQALIKHNTESLHTIAVIKGDLLTTLDKNYQWRLQQLSQHKLPINEHGIELFIKQTASKETQHHLLVRWQRLQTHIQRCQQQNKINGMIINANQQAIKRLKQTLFAQNSELTELYSREGQTHNVGKSRPMDEA